MLQATINGQEKFEVEQVDGIWHIGKEPTNWDMQLQPNGLISILFEGRSFTAILENIDRKLKEITLRINGQTYTVAITEAIDQLLASMGLDLKAMQKIEPLKAPMPGMVLKILVTEGQQIEKGDALLILEAMKMENVLKASGNAKVKAIKVEEKKAVEKGTILLELE